MVFIDNDELFVRTIGERLGIRDFSYQTLKDPLDVLPYLQEIRPNLILIDLDILQGRHVEIIRQIRELEPLCKMIVYSSTKSFLEEAETIPLGIFYFLKKPVDPDLLVETIYASIELLQKETKYSYGEAIALAEEDAF